MDTQQSLICEFEKVIEFGSIEKRAEVFRRLTNLLFLNAGSYSDKQVAVFVDLFSHLTEWIDTKTRAEFAIRLAPAKNVPAAIVRVIARDPAIEVAGPILTQSTQLTEEDLLACANGKSHEWFLAISRRSSLSEGLSDLLATQDNQEVIRSVAENIGARFSDVGFSKLVEKSRDDDLLASSIAQRKDIPQKYLFDLGCNASGAVFEKIVHEIVLARETEIKRDFTQAKELYESTLHSGKPVEPVIYGYASSGKLEETIVALSFLCHLPIEAVGNIMGDKRVKNDMILVLAKCAGLPWQSAKLILQLHCKESGLASEEIEKARQYFDQLQAATAQRLVRFYQARHNVNQASN